MPELTLFNTLTRQQEPVQPLEPGHVRIYACGPTVYHFVHIGNLRTFLWVDLLRRYLIWKGLRVTLVMNLTDVDDRIINNARDQKISIDDYTAPYTQAFFDDIDSLRIGRADIYPRATEHIPEMLALVKHLSDGGHTYLTEGSTYFRISTLPDYGKLSRIEINRTSAFSRVDSDTDDKLDARDFVLWKARKEGEHFWDTEIGPGRPGWHLECSAMSMKYLGETFDIHTGAVDLIFPHHENEIAQSEGATGRPFVKMWVHGEHLVVEERKMSKREGNFYTLRDLFEQGYSALQIRYALLSVPYRTKLNFTTKSLDDAKSALQRVELFLLRLDELQGGKAGEPGQRGRELADALIRDFEASMDDDLNTSGALAALFTLIREANTAIDEHALGAGDARVIRDAIRKVNEVLDLLPLEEASLEAEVEELIEQRNAARKERNFPESDRLRDLLLEKGIILEDTAAGTRWRRR